MKEKKKKKKKKKDVKGPPTLPLLEQRNYTV